MRHLVLLAFTLSAFAGAPRAEVRLDTSSGLEQNRGQARAGILYIYRPDLYLTATPGFTYAPDQVRIDFAGANPAATLSPSDTLPGTLNFVSGNEPSKWISGVTRVRQLRSPSVYPGIDATHYVDTAGLHLRWTIAPGADLSAIRFHVTGAAPGEIVTLLGSGLGPQTGVSFVLDAQEKAPRELGGTRVYFDGVAVPVLYAQNSQVNAIPFALTPGQNVKVEVEYGGTRVAVTDSVVDSRPSFFTLDGTGTGPIAVLNQDQSINSSKNPASTGSIVSFFLTGSGAPAIPLREGEAATAAGAAPQSAFQVALPGPAERYWTSDTPALLRAC